MPDMNSLLDKPIDSFEPPKALPQGSYIFAVLRYEFKKSPKQQTDFVQYKVKPVQPMEDVDQTDLAAVEGWQDKEMNLDFYITPDALYRLKDFLEKDVKAAAPGTPTREAIQAAVSGQFVGMVGHSQSTKNPEVVYANITQTAPVPE